MPNTPAGAFFPHWPEFIHLAAEACDNATAIEAADPRAWPMRDALSAILFSAIATEAFINELPEAAARDVSGLRDIQLPATPILDDLAATLGTIEDAQGNIQLKYHMARKILTGRTFDPGAAVFQDFDQLVRLRNDLVHPRHRDRTTPLGYTEPASATVRALQQRGLTQTRGRQAGDPKGGMSWLSEIYCGRTATWAHGAACSVIAELIRALPQDDRLWLMNRFRDWLSSPQAQVRSPVT